MRTRRRAPRLPLWLAWLAGIPALFGTILAAAVAVALLVQRQALAGLVATAAAGLLLLLFVACQSGIHGHHARRVAAAERARRALTDSAPKPLPTRADRVVVRLRLLRWCMALVLLGLVVVAGWWMTVLMWHEQDAEGLVLALPFTLIIAAGLLSIGRLGPASDRAGAVLRLDESGLRHCLLPVIPWTAVRGIDLQETGADPRRLSWTLVVAVDPSVGRTLALPWWRRWIDWCVPRLDASGTRLSIDLAFLRAHPQQVAGAAVTMAQRHGARLHPGWRHWQTGAAA